MSREYCDHLIDMLAPWAPTVARKMFGGFGLYRGGLMFAIVADDALYLKVDNHNRADYEAAGCEPFTYEAKGRRVTLSYWQAPAEALDDETTLGECAEKAYAAALRGQEAKQPRAIEARQQSPHRPHALPWAEIRLVAEGCGN